MSTDEKFLILSITMITIPFNTRIYRHESLEYCPVVLHQSWDCYIVAIACASLSNHTSEKSHISKSRMNPNKIRSDRCFPKQLLYSWYKQAMEALRGSRCLQLSWNYLFETSSQNVWNSTFPSICSDLAAFHHSFLQKTHIKAILERESESQGTVEGEKMSFWNVWIWSTHRILIQNLELPLNYPFQWCSKSTLVVFPRICAHNFAVCVSMRWSEKNCSTWKFAPEIQLHEQEIGQKTTFMLDQVWSWAMKSISFSAEVRNMLACWKIPRIHRCWPWEQPVFQCRRVRHQTKTKRRRWRNWCHSSTHLLLRESTSACRCLARHRWSSKR